MLPVGGGEGSISAEVGRARRPTEVPTLQTLAAALSCGRARLDVGVRRMDQSVCVFVVCGLLGESQSRTDVSSAS